MRAVRAKAQHSAAAEGLHCTAVHFPTRAAHGLSARVLREAGEGGGEADSESAEGQFSLRLSGRGGVSAHEPSGEGASAARSL